MATVDTSAPIGMQRALRLAGIGTIAGLFSGLFGVGGGIVIVPLLILWLHYDTRVATGTSLAAIVIIASAAMLTHSSHGNVHLEEGLLIGLPATGGALVGTYVQQRVPRSAVRIVFAVMIAGIAILMLVNGDTTVSGDGDGDGVPGGPAAVIALGVVAGVLSGLLGVGGGVLFVPTLTLAVGLGVVEAEATSLLAMIPVALAGSLSQRRYGNVRVLDAAILGLLAVPGAFLGVLIVENIPTHVTRIAFSLLVLFTAWKLLRSGLEERRRERAGHA